MCSYDEILLISSAHSFFSDTPRVLPILQYLSLAAVGPISCYSLYQVSLSCWQGGKTVGVEAAGGRVQSNQFLNISESLHQNEWTMCKYVPSSLLHFQHQ